MTILWWLGARGWTARRSMALVGTLAAPFVGSLLALQLRTPADSEQLSQVLDHGVVLGLAVPIGTLGTFLEDRSWRLQATGSRRLWLPRLAYALLLLGCAGLVGMLTAWLLAGRDPAGLILADTLLLWALGWMSALVVGARNAWAVPLALALCCSVPGFVPLGLNILSLASRRSTTLALGSVLCAAAALLFALFDEWGLNAGRRAALDAHVAP